VPPDIYPLKRSSLVSPIVVNRKLCGGLYNLQPFIALRFWCIVFAEVAGKVHKLEVVRTVISNLAMDPVRARLKELVRRLQIHQPATESARERRSLQQFGNLSYEINGRASVGSLALKDGARSRHPRIHKRGNSDRLFIQIVSALD
jgi:hypothetical protein